MATQLKNIIAFTAVGAGVQAMLPHGLNISGEGVIPDKIEFDNGAFTYISADATNVTVRNDDVAPADLNVLCEHWHTLERTFGAVSVTALTPQPFVVEGEGGPGGVTNPLILKTGDGDVTAPASFASGAIGDVTENGGAAEVSVANGAGFAVGQVSSYAGATCKVQAYGAGSFASGRIDAYDAYTFGILAYVGSHAHGHVLGNFDASIEAYGFGATAAGYCYAAGNVSNIAASWDGAFAGGAAFSTADLALIEASTLGAFAFGAAIGGSIQASGSGSVAVGYVNGGSQILANDEGAFAGGKAEGGDIEATNEGAFAFGQTKLAGVIGASAQGTHAGGFATGGNIYASGIGSTARGFARGGADVLANGQGAFASGYTYGTGSDIRASSRGTLAAGFAYEGGTIRALNDGAVALGFAAAVGGSVSAGGAGSFAAGHADAYGISSSGSGSFAFGTAKTADIIASAINSAQFGEGSNALADSLQIGSAGIRFKGTVGAPGAPQNGDQWIDGAGNVVIRSGGVSVIIA